MRAARSASARMTSTPRVPTSESGVSASRSAQLRMVASGLFSSCATPETVWPIAAIFSRCEQLLVQVARLVVEPFALGDVAKQRVDQHAAAVGRADVRRDVHEHRRLVGPAHPQQIVRDLPFAREPIQERGASRPRR